MQKIHNIAQNQSFVQKEIGVKIIEPILESYPQVFVTTSLNGFASYLLTVVYYL